MQRQFGHSINLLTVSYSWPASWCRQSSFMDDFSGLDPVEFGASSHTGFADLFAALSHILKVILHC